MNAFNKFQFSNNHFTERTINKEINYLKGQNLYYNNNFQQTLYPELNYKNDIYSITEPSDIDDNGLNNTINQNLKILQNTLNKTTNNDLLNHPITDIKRNYSKKI